MISLAFKRLLNIIVAALNYQYLGRAATLEEIGRCPNTWQRSCFGRLRTLIAACGTDPEPFSLAPGRSGPELGAALFQLEQFAELPEVAAGGYKELFYQRFFDDPLLFPEESYPQLRPYRSLDSSRLKLTGSGRWNMQKHIDGELWLPFVEPRFLLHDQMPDPDDIPAFSKESYEENLKLIRLWDSKGLLELFEEPIEEGFYSKVFNAFKNETTDRQIGDRRYGNQRERHILGPSRYLPQGPQLVCFQVRRFREKVLGSITDRRDFYHQAAVSSSRARSNLLPFRFDLPDLAGTSALEAFEKNLQKKKGYRRDLHGDRLGVDGGPTKRKRSLPAELYGGFKSLFQGDHLGVEFALQAHSGLLSAGGLLHEDRRLLGNSPLPLGSQWEALVIDDYFAIGAEDVNAGKLNSFAARALAEARGIYEAEEVIGSIEKDVEASCFFKAAGAEVNSMPSIVRGGAVTVSAPSSKRLALSALSLRAARLPCITNKLASRLTGNWVSVLLYRKCLSCVVTGLFSLAADLEEDAVNTIVPFGRNLADELVVLASLSPVIASNIAVPTSTRVNAVDASLGLGAVTSTAVPRSLADSLWLGGDRRGKSVVLDNPFRATLAAVGEELDDFPEKIDSSSQDASGPGRPLMMQYDFVEFFGGAGVISKFAASLGLVCAPPLDLTKSEHYDLHGHRLTEWCCHMLSSGRFRSCAIEPPCTSFSPAAHPSVRSYVEPWGYDRSDFKTLLGNTSALRAFTLLWFCFLFDRPSLFEQPRLSKMCWTHLWKAFLRRGLKEALVASCQFGSPHRKEFRLLTWLLDAAAIETRCPGGHQHLRIEGRYTKPSATYTDALGLHLAKAFRAALEKIDRNETPDVGGLESLVVNDLLSSHQWEVSRSWRWKSKSHINVLETSTIVSLLKELARTQPDMRHNIFSDSQVAIGAIAKGRSPSFLLQRQCKISGALQVAAGLYPSFNYAPTRLNNADDPTRLVEIRRASGQKISSKLPPDVLHSLHHHRFSRPVAGWIRLVLLLIFPTVTEAAAAQLSSPLCFWTSVVSGSVYLLGLVFFGFACLCWTCWFVVSVIGCLRHLGPLGVVAVVTLASPAAAMEPSSAIERERAFARTAVNLEATRTVRTETRAGREKLLEAFRIWLYEEEGQLLSVLLTEKPADPEKVSHLLANYGKSMFVAGKSYGRYSETINAVAAARPAWRKNFNEAWDLAFAWLADEPHQHHPALPLSILLSMISVALLWGWPTEAALLALTWAGILRIGEVFLATRGDLILPDDSAPGTTYILLRIRTPKTRGRAAQHQAARVDAKDFVLLITKVYENLRPEEPLWPFSAATLRKRFEALLGAVGLSAKGQNGHRPFSLGSLRPGGATHLLFLTEDSELTRRRGRWLSHRTMEIYLQEILVATAVEKLPKDVREKIKSFAASFPAAMDFAIRLMELGIPPSVWHALFRHMTQ